MALSLTPPNLELQTIQSPSDLTESPRILRTRLMFQVIDAFFHFIHNTFTRRFSLALCARLCLQYASIERRKISYYRHPDPLHVRIPSSHMSPRLCF